jgi:adenylate kinase family enzyme
MARRIVVWGCTGSGKTTAARKIGQLTGLPVIDGDALCWRPGWVGVPRDEQAAAFAAVASRPEWVLDDDGPGGMMFAEADLLVLLDYPRWVSFQRLLRRCVNRAVTQTPVCNGNYESWGRLLSLDSQLLWHVRTWKRKRRVMLDLAGENPERVLLFRRPAELTAWITVFGH